MTGRVSESLQSVVTEKDEWHVAHQGPLIDIVGQVWWCGDDWCDCSQAQIVARFSNIIDPRFLVLRTLWQGEFHTDGETGAGEELSAKRSELQDAEPAIAARVRWLD
jgi:hypothetical protein